MYAAPPFTGTDGLPQSEDNIVVVNRNSLSYIGVHKAKLTYHTQTFELCLNIVIFQVFSPNEGQHAIDIADFEYFELWQAG